MRKQDQRSDAASAYRSLYHSARWTKLRLIQLNREPLCKICRDAGALTDATVADHIVPHRGDPDLFYDIDNLQSLCKTCHDSTKQQEERLGYSLQIGIDGRPVDPRHPGYR